MLLIGPHGAMALVGTPRGHSLQSGVSPSPPEDQLTSGCSPSNRSASLTVEEAAHRLGVHPQTIYLWIRTGLLKADQVTSGAPWAVYVTDHDLRRLTAEDALAGWRPLREAASELGVSHQSVLNWVKQSKIDYVYVSRGRRRGLRINVASATYRAQSPLFS